MAAEECVRSEECGNGLMVITIDRPKALNAVNPRMVAELRAALARCREGTVRAVLVQGAGEKGLCSGGDVKALFPVVKESQEVSTAAAALEQFFEEYNAIFEFKQLSLAMPTVALCHGITMGFGLGLGASARYAVATEKSRLAMPENNIGLFPDAGFAHLAANLLPRGFGRLMALTGCHLGAGDAVAAKLASHFVRVEDAPRMLEALRGADLGADADAAVQAALELATSAAPAPQLLLPDGGATTLLDKFAEAPSLREAFDMLAQEAEAGGQAQELLAAARKGAPFSQAVAFHLLRAAEEDKAQGLTEPSSLAVALERDFVAAQRVMWRADFAEGLRAVLVDKDQNARWEPADLAGVQEEAVEAILGDGARALGLPK